MFLKLIKTGVIAGTLAFVSSGVSAKTLLQTFIVSSAESSQFNSSGGHSVWLPNETAGGGSADHFDFLSNGRFKIFDDGTATLTGRAVWETNPAMGANYFDVDASFGLPTAAATPKLELSSSGGVDPYTLVDPSTWRFFTLTSGILTGGGVFDGRTLNLTQAPVGGTHPFQVGFGANGKNLNFGGSGWFTYTGGNCSTSCRGDFNVDLSAVPIPAAGLLLPLAIGGLAMVGRRRRRMTA